MTEDQQIRQNKPRRKRGVRGRGSVYLRGAVYWIAFTRGGKRYADTSLCTRQDDAVDVIDRCFTAIRNGTFTSIAAVRDGTRDGAPDTLAAVAERWLEHAAKVTRDAKGYELARTRVALYFTPFLGKNEASKLTTDDLMDYRGQLAGQKAKRRNKNGTVVETKRTLSVQTQSHILSDCRALLLWAEGRGLVPRGVVPKKKLLPRVPEKPLRALTVEQQTAVRAVEEPYGFAVRIMIESGARWSELCRLTRDDLQDGELVIHGPTKSGKMRRVPIATSLVAEIKGHLGRLVPFEQKDDPSFNRAVRLRSGVEAFSAHACRHSYGFNYMARGGNLLALKEQMGHSTITLTALYAQPSQEFVRSDAAKVIGWRT